MIYDVTDHPLLIPKVKELTTSDPEQFAAQVEVAEVLLALPATVPADPAGAQLHLAVAMQVNFQIQQGIDPLFIESSASSHSRNSVSYRDRFIDPRAAQIVATIITTLGGRYTERITSFRTNEKTRSYNADYYVSSVHLR